MRPVGKHRPRSSPRGDQSSLCDICGVLWYLSALTRKPDGKLYCPDDVKGADSVTLSLANARDAASAGRVRATRAGGAKDTSGFPTEEMPTGILSNCTGWWGPRDARLGNGVRAFANIPSFDTTTAGNLTQPDIPSRPTYLASDTSSTFASGDFLSSRAHPFTTSGGGLGIWCVGTFTSTAAADSLFSLTNVGGQLPYAPASYLRTYIGLTAANTLGAVVGTATPATGTATVAFSDTGLHLFYLHLSASELVLYLDGDIVATTALTGGTAKFTNMYMGTAVTVPAAKGDAMVMSSHVGQCNEIVINDGIASASEIAAMEVYFNRNYPTLPGAA